MEDVHGGRVVHSFDPPINHALQVRSDYCKLSWEAPEDDGGTAITQSTSGSLQRRPRTGPRASRASSQATSTGTESLFSSLISSLVILNLNPL